MAADVVLQQFARAPRPGGVKTRMQPTLSAEEACALHCELVRWTSAQLLESRLGEVELWVAGDDADPLFQGCRELGVARLHQQRGADLGERMLHALHSGLETAHKVVLVGSDCPALSPAYLAAAVTALDRAPLVLGPAEDGGFVLIGATAAGLEANLFSAVEWGSSSVCRTTLENIARAKLTVVKLPALADIDRPEDLPLWEALKGVTI